MAATALPSDARALGSLLRNVRATLRAVRAGPAAGDLAGTLDSLAESAAATMVDLGFAEAERAGREAEERAARNPRRSRVPRQRPDRHGLRSVPGGRSRLTAVPAVAALVALVFAPSHAARAAEGARPVVVSASRPPVRVLDPSKAQRRDERTAPDRGRL